MQDYVNLQIPSNTNPIYRARLTVCPGALTKLPKREVEKYTVLGAHRIKYVKEKK